MERVLVTGANGFVGTFLCNHLTQKGYNVTKAVRAATRSDEVSIGNISANTDWSKALAECTVVIHLASRVHVMNEKAADPLAEFRQVNVFGTLGLARQAAANGVRRFVFLSSVKVNGEQTTGLNMFAADDAPRPSDPYGVSKLEAESSLKQVAVDTGMQVAIIRPPLIYGPGVKANFRKMMQWVNAGIPLPLGNIRNRRSLVGIQNLVDLIEIGISHEAAGNQTFMVSDGNDVSTSELLRQMAKALGVQSRLVSVPQSWIERFAALIGRSDLAQRLCGSLRIDIEKTRSLLGWNPSVSLEDGLRAVVASNRKNDF